MDVTFWVWLGVFVVTFIIEAATAELVSIWFTIGSIVPMILAAAGVAWQIQVVVFFLVSVVLIFSLRGITKKFITKSVTEKTNLEALVGKKFHLQSRTDDETVGSIKIYGVVWGAIEQNGGSIESGELVEIVGVQGNKLIVVKVDASQKNPKENAEKPEKNGKKIEKNENEEEK